MQNKYILKILKRQHVKVSTKYWSVINVSDVKQTKSISQSQIHFPTKLVTIKTFTPHDSITMLNFLIDNIYVQFVGIICQQVI